MQQVVNFSPPPPPPPHHTHTHTPRPNHADLSWSVHALCPQPAEYGFPLWSVLLWPASCCVSSWQEMQVLPVGNLLLIESLTFYSQCAELNLVNSWYTVQSLTWVTCDVQSLAWLTHDVQSLTWLTHVVQNLTWVTHDVQSLTWLTHAVQSLAWLIHDDVQSLTWLTHSSLLCSTDKTDGSTSTAGCHVENWTFLSHSD